MRRFMGVQSFGMLCLLVAGCADSHEAIEGVDAGGVSDMSVSFDDASSHSRVDGSAHGDGALDAPTTCDPGETPECGEQCGVPVEAVCSGDPSFGYFWQCVAPLHPCEAFCNPSEAPICPNHCDGAAASPYCDHSTGEWSCPPRTDECGPQLTMCPTSTSVYVGVECSEEGAICGEASCCENSKIWCHGGTWVGVPFDGDGCEDLDCLPPYTCGAGSCAFGELCILDEDVYQCLHIQSGEAPSTCEQWAELIHLNDERQNIECESTEPFGFLYARYVF